MGRWIRIALVPAAVAVALAGVAFATPRSVEVRASRAGGPVQVTHFYKLGPSASCDGDACEMGIVPPLTVAVPAGGPTYAATVTVSFQYRTSAVGEFGFRVTVRDAGGHRVTVVPGGRKIAASPTPQSTTLVFASRALLSGTTYRVDLGTSVLWRGASDKASIRTSRVLVTVALDP